MLIQELFRRATLQRSEVTQSIATRLAPAIFKEFAAIPALGGSGKLSVVQEPELQELLDAIPAFTPEELQNFSKKGFDQSLATHLVNGLFAGIFLAERLPEHKVLEAEGLHIWALGFTVHDYTKAYGRKVSAGQLPIARQLVTKLGDRLRFEEFLPQWQQYLDDIVFVAQNTQTVQGANLNLRDYRFQLDKRQRETIRMLSSVTDLLVHITSPSDVLYRDIRGRDLAYNLREKMETLFGAEFAPRLAYHKLLEVRGLLSNLLNNSLIDVLNKQGYEPFLFFPEGVIYLAPRQIQAQIDVQAVAGAAWKRITRSLTGGQQDSQTEQDEENEDEDQSEEGRGLKIARSKDYMRVPEVLYELLSLPTLMEMGRQVALNIKNSRTTVRLGAEQAEELGQDIKRLSPQQKEELYQKLGSEWARQQHLPTDARVDQLAEFLGFLYRRIFLECFPKVKGVTAMLLDSLELSDDISPERAERQKGGTPTGWFYVASRYVQAHPTLDPNDLENVMKMLEAKALQFISEQGKASVPESATEQIFLDYARRIIEIDGGLIAGKDNVREQFAGEILRYIQNKASNRLVCSLCASPYTADEQIASTVLFKPQQYSNKAPLDTSQLKRGICPICSLEMMLRMVQQGLPGKETQDKKAVNLYLYPTYFFTTETAEVVRLFFDRLRDLYLPRLIFSHLEKHGFTYQNLFTYEDFLVDDDNIPPAKGVWKTWYSDEDQAALFFVTLHPIGQKPTETDAWILPTFYALALPLLLGVKCVATPSFVALYTSASDFQETVRIDGGHEFVRHLLNKEHFRIDETRVYMERLLHVYSLHLDVYNDGNDQHWGQLNTIVKDLVTDPLYVFQYFERRQRRSSEDKKKGKGGKQGAPAQKSTGISSLDQQRYMGVYFAIGGCQNMDFIGRLVDAYAQFYRADWGKLDSAYAVLRPLGTAIKVVVDSDPDTNKNDLYLLVAGAVNDDQERVRSDRAEGFDPITTRKDLGNYATRLALSRQKIDEFAHLFVDECFAAYCDGDRAVLRERANRIRSAARFYYLTHYSSASQQKV